MDGRPPRSEIDHRPGRAQHWHDADEDLRTWIDSVVEITAAIDGHRSTILHGSLSTGTFVRPKSDVDVLVVVADRLPDETCWRVSRALVDAHDRRPMLGGLELSALTTADLDPLRDAPHYELHVGESCADDIRAGTTRPTGTDPDLPAHVHHARRTGIALAGVDPVRVLPEVPTAQFLTAVEADLVWILDAGLDRSPVYGVLNICRCAQLQAGAETAPTKAGAATWALTHLPSEHRPLIADALECYRSAATIDPAERRHHGHTWPLEPLERFARWAADTLVPLT